MNQTNNPSSLTARYIKKELIKAIQGVPDSIIYLTIQAGTNETILTGRKIIIKIKEY